MTTNEGLRGPDGDPGGGLHETLPMRLLRLEVLTTSADARARDALTAVQNMRDRGLTREQHEALAAKTGKKMADNARTIRRLTVTALVAMAVTLFGGTYSLLAQDRSREQTDRELLRIQQALLTSCHTRNDQLTQQRLAYEGLIEADRNDGSSSAAVRVAVLQRTLQSLPEQVDCSIYRRTT